MRARAREGEGAPPCADSRRTHSGFSADSRRTHGPFPSCCISQALYHQARMDPVAVQHEDLAHAGALLRDLGAHHEAALVDCLTACRA